MDGEGFEPSKAELTDLQSAPFGHSGTHPYLIYKADFQLRADERTRTVNLLITSQLSPTGRMEEATPKMQNYKKLLTCLEYQ